MGALISLARFEVDFVLDMYRKWDPGVDGEFKYWTVEGQDIRTRMTSLRYAIFSQSIACVVCQMKGDHFLLERFSGNNLATAHFNLYATLPDGDRMLFTKDHIMPKSKGGSDKLSNLQTMCMKCNGEKGDSIPASAA